MDSRKGIGSAAVHGVFIWAVHGVHLTGCGYRYEYTDSIVINKLDLNEGYSFRGRLAAENPGLPRIPVFLAGMSAGVLRARAGRAAGVERQSAGCSWASSRLRTVCVEAMAGESPRC